MDRFEERAGEILDSVVDIGVGIPSGPASALYYEIAVALRAEYKRGLEDAANIARAAKAARDDDMVSRNSMCEIIAKDIERAVRALEEK